jgi:hypothetical protein
MSLLNLLETRESLGKLESFFNGFWLSKTKLGCLREARRNLLSSGRSKENARHFFLCAQTIVDKDIQVTGTVTWQARPKMLIRASGDQKIVIADTLLLLNSPGGFLMLLLTSRQRRTGSFWLPQNGGGVIH